MGVKALLIAAVAASLVLVPVASAQASAKEFANCTALNKVYPHGVGKPRARDHSTGTPVTTFTKNTAVYSANIKSDRDRDGVACEKA